MSEKYGRNPVQTTSGRQLYLNNSNSTVYIFNPEDELS